MKLKAVAGAVITSLSLSAHAGFFDSLTDALKPKTGTEASLADSANTAQTEASANAGVDLTKMITVPMTARQLFDQQGMYATLGMAAKMQADAKSSKSSAFGDGLASLTGDTAALLRLATRMTASYLQYTALETLIKSASDNDNIMNEIKIDVPQVGGLSMQLQGEILGVARFLAAMKASNLLVIESDKSLEAAKTRYLKLMNERDEKAMSLGQANMLINGVFQMKEEQLKATSAEDLEYLKQFYGKPLDEVRKDKQAWHMLDRELRVRYPGEYTSILGSEKEVATHYGQYAKTSVGTLSMLGFASVFIGNVMDMGAKSHLHKILLVPMAKDGVVELVSIVKNVSSALSRNDDLIEGTFTVTTNGKTVKGIPASQVLKSLPDEQLNAFRSDLIGAESKSYVSRLDKRSPLFAADILDRLVDRDIKEDVAKTSLAIENPDTFSFKTAFSADNVALKAKGVDAQKVKLRVYEENLESATDEKDKSIGKLQVQIKKDATKISNQDLRRIMMMGDSKESLVVGNSVIRLEQPGLQGLADQQELHAMTLAAQVTQDVKSQKATAKEAPAAAPAEPTAGKKGTGGKASKSKSKA